MYHELNQKESAKEYFQKAFSLTHSKKEQELLLYKIEKCN
jgi:predicted RNA polymerase sigma factor